MSTRPGSGLGRGLSALIGDAAVPKAAVADPRGERGVREIEISSIRPNPGQPRRMFTEESLQELADSISERGVLQPILVRPTADGFEIIAGERRWRAAQRARPPLHRIPAIVREIDDSGMAEIALIENVQREDLNAVEEAEGYRQLIERYGHTQNDVSQLVHKSRSHITNLLRLLDLPDAVRQALVRGEMTMGHARAISAAEDPEALAEQIIAQGLSVRQAEALARRVKPGAGLDTARGGQRQAQRSADADIEALERQLSDATGLKVKIANKGGSGTVTLTYSSLDQLDMICQRLTGEAI